MTLPTIKITQPSAGTTVNTLPNSGQQTMADSLPVTLASNQSALSIVGSVSVSNWPVTLPVSFTSAQHVIVDSLPSSGGSLVDVGDRAGRQLGVVNDISWSAAQHVIVDSAPAAGADVTDRAGRQLGVVNSVSGTVAVTGTFWQATQPVSGTITANAGTNLNTSALALDATLTGGTQQSKITDGTNVATVKAASTLPAATDKALVVTARDSLAVTGTFWQATQPVSGTFWQATQPVNAASLPLPAGASTSAKQPALGTAGTASADVLSVQGIASMTALKVDGSAVTQPVSGTFWQATQPVSGTVTANAGTNLNTSALALDATLTGNNARARITDGTNLAAVKAASTAPAAADPALVVALSPNMGPTSNSLLPSAAATINATTVKASAGRLYKVKGYNAKASVVYLKFWNKAASVPAPASDTALIVFSFPLKASEQFDIDLTPVGYAFATGIGYTISTGSANNDATAVLAADIVGLNVMYA